MKECTGVVVGSWGGSWGPTGPSLFPPRPLPLKKYILFLISLWGRIDVVRVTHVQVQMDT